MILSQQRQHNIDPDSLNALPTGSGVYIFKGQGTLPLYIGKSVNIRSRVLSHLRTPDEAKMIAQTRRIDFIETAGELGALLLEARMIKEQSPLFNQRLRRTRRLCSIQLFDENAGLALEIVDSKAVNLEQPLNYLACFHLGILPKVNSTSSRNSMVCVKLF